MPAPDFPTLYDFETQIEDAFKSAIIGLLTANNLIASVYVSQDPLTKTTPRIELSVSMGAALSQMTTKGQANPKQNPNASEFTISAVIATTRLLPDDDGGIHGPLRGLVRYALSAGAKQIGDANLSFLQILECLPVGGTPQVVDEKNTDKTELVYGGKIAIRNEAWPSQP